VVPFIRNTGPVHPKEGLQTSINGVGLTNLTLRMAHRLIFLCAVRLIRTYRIDLEVTKSYLCLKQRRIPLRENGHFGVRGFNLCFGIVFYSCFQLYNNLIYTFQFKFILN